MKFVVDRKKLFIDKIFIVFPSEIVKHVSRIHSLEFDGKIFSPKSADQMDMLIADNKTSSTNFTWSKVNSNCFEILIDINSFDIVSVSKVIFDEHLCHISFSIDFDVNLSGFNLNKDSIKIHSNVFNYLNLYGGMMKLFLEDV